MAPALRRLVPASAALVLLALPAARADRAADPKYVAGGDVDDDAAVSGAAADLFRKLDTDRDGRIDARELSGAVAPDALAGSSAAAWLARSLTLADADGDGALSDAGEAEEFVGRILAKDLFKFVVSVSSDDDGDEEPEVEAATVERPVADFFRQLDADQDGSVSEEELVIGMEAMGVASDPEPVEAARELFAEADAGKDGGLDRAEAEHFLKLLEEATGVPLFAPMPGDDDEEEEEAEADEGDEEAAHAKVDEQEPAEDEYEGEGDEHAAAAEAGEDDEQEEGGEEDEKVEEAERAEMEDHETSEDDYDGGEGGSAAQTVEVVEDEERGEEDDEVEDEEVPDDGELEVGELEEESEVGLEEGSGDDADDQP